MVFSGCSMYWTASGIAHQIVLLGYVPSDSLFHCFIGTFRLFTVSTWRHELPHMESWTLSCLHLRKEHWSDWVSQNFTHIRWANNNTKILIVKGGFSNAWIALWWSTMILKFPWTTGSWSECSNQWEEYCGGHVNCKWKVLVLQRSCLGGAFKESQCLCSLLVSYKGTFQSKILRNLYWC